MVASPGWEDELDRRVALETQKLRADLAELDDKWRVAHQAIGELRGDLSHAEARAMVAEERLARARQLAQQLIEQITRDALY